MQPFKELTNRTPSPSQKDDAFQGRKHSPWTAARHKKKTRSVQQQPLDALPAYHHPQLPGHQQQQQQQPAAGAECFHSPERAKASGNASAAAAGPEYSFGLADAAAQHQPHGSRAASPHSSPVPASSKGGSAAQDADGQRCCSADLKSSSAGRHVMMDADVQQPSGLGVEAAAGGQGSEQHSLLHHSSSAPACNNLLERFGAAAAGAGAATGAATGDSQQLSCDPPGQVAAAGGHRRLTARRRSWGGPGQQQQQQQGSHGAASILGSSSWQQHQQHHQQEHRRDAGAGCQELDGDFRLRSRLGSTAAGDEDVFVTCDGTRRALGGSTQQHSLGSSGSSFLRRLAGWQDDDDSSSGGALPTAAAARAAAAAGGLCFRGAAAAAERAAAAEPAEEGSLPWFEQQVHEAAEGGDLLLAQQLWAALQASGLPPSRRFMHAFLMCCHYGGCDPIEAQQAVREMCAAGGLAPNAATAQLLAAVDMGWQQLCCGAQQP